MKLTNRGAVPVYTISGSTSARPLPEWLARQRRRSLKQDPEYANRIELLQDFEFEEASSCIRVSDDGDWVVSTGTYKPQIHVHYLPHLSLSYTRHTDCENRSFILLSSDYSKQLHLQNDRSLEFHTPQGRHYATRIPRYGRDLLYDKQSAEALIPAVGVDAGGMGEVYRLNLEIGRFMKPYSVDVGGDDYTSHGGGALQGGINTGSVNTAAIAESSHNLLAFGTSLGTVEFWDSRNRDRVALLKPPASFSDNLDFEDFRTRAQVTSLQFHTNGLNLATGSSTGLVHLYDLRSPIPLLKKDQGYGYPIHTLKFLENNSKSGSHGPDTPKILSADKRIIKIWDGADGTPWTHVESAVDLHNVEWCRDTGMLLTSNEGRQQHSFFIPSLGPAPRWCSFLDNLVEELAEDASDPNAYNAGIGGHKGGEVYDNYKFVTPKQLVALGLEDKIGTNLLKPYMHGYFMRQELYEEARILAQPEIWAERRQQSIRERVEKEHESRIRGTKREITARVNKKLAQQILDRDEKNERRKARRELAKRSQSGVPESNGAVDDAADETQVREPKSRPKRETILTDPRFAALFNDEDFAIDETSHEFRALNPATRVEQGDAERHDQGLTAVDMEEMDQSTRRRYGEDSSSDDNDSEDEGNDYEGSTKNKQDKSYEVGKGKQTKLSTQDYKRSRRRPVPQNQRPRVQMKASVSAAGARPGSQRRDRSFGSMIKAESRHGGGRQNMPHRVNGNSRVVGAKEITFSFNDRNSKGK